MYEKVWLRLFPNTPQGNLLTNRLSMNEVDELSLRYEAPALTALDWSSFLRETNTSLTEK